MAMIRKTRLVVMPGMNTPYEHVYYEDDGQPKVVETGSCIFCQSDPTSTNLIPGYECVGCGLIGVRKLEETAIENLNALDVILGETNAEKVGTGTETGSGGQELERDAQGCVRLWDTPEDGVDAGTSESSSGTTQER